MTHAVTKDPRAACDRLGFPDQTQEQPGLTEQTTPKPDHGERTYEGALKLSGRRALITGGDSGIGRAVAIAFAREGADVAISHLPEEQADAEETAALVTTTAARALPFPATSATRSSAPRSSSGPSPSSAGSTSWC